jgi:Big-like domain-containing protein
MPHTTFLIVRPALVVLVLGAFGCSSDLVLPDAPSSAAQTIALTKANGDDQHGPVGEALKPLVVRVLDQQQHPMIGLSVSFELSDPSGGTIDPATATTNSVGEALANWTLGSVPGSYTVLARLVGVEGEDKVAEFHALADPGAAAGLTAQSPLNQPGRREQQVQSAPVVQVVDRFGNPVPNAPVLWQVIAGEGQVSNPTTTTDPAGTSSVDWTLGNRIGVHKLTASLPDGVSPVTFTASVLF